MRGDDWSALRARALALHRDAPLVDGHNDLAWALRERVASLEFEQLDIRQPQPSLMTDIPRLRAGGVGAQFWAAYVPSTVAGPAAVRLALEQIDVIHRMCARYSDVFELARSADDVLRITASGRIASILAVEGGHAIDGSLAVLRMMHALGARYLTLTHNDNVAWADSATDEPVLHGLSAFGRQVVREMNRLGMIVDLSHVSPDTMHHALDTSVAPIIFSHSSARARCDVPRNVPDDVLRRLAVNGGVAMMSFVPVFLSPDAPVRYRLIMAERSRLRAQFPNDPNAVAEGMERLIRAHGEPKATVAMVADHIDHARDVAGVDHVGIGSDFDGITSAPEGLEDVSRFPALTEELLRRGYSDDDVLKVLGRNILRVMREAERIAHGVAEGVVRRG